jgi:hypothetical protein
MERLAGSWHVALASSLGASFAGQGIQKNLHRRSDPFSFHRAFFNYYIVKAL